MSKGNFEVALPKPHLVGDISASVYEVGGASPTTIISANQDWGVRIRWDLRGSLAPYICGDWCLHLRLESMGPGRELLFSLPRRIPVNPCGPGRYYVDFRIKRGTIRPHHCSIPYKPVVTLSYYTKCNKPGPIAGFVELPIVQFYDNGIGTVYGGNGRHAAEVGEAEEAEFEMAEMFEQQEAEMFDAEAVETSETGHEGEGFEHEAAADLGVESKKELAS